MVKQRHQYACQECGYVSRKWYGRCPDCQKFNSLIEEIAPENHPSDSPHRGMAISSNKPQPIATITASDEDRLTTDISEFDRVLGGGLVPGSVVLIGGDPGIGKSTLLLQMGSQLSQTYGPVLYVSGEESASQTKLRANRLDINSDSLYVLCENNYEQIESHISDLNPQVVLVDSIQTIYLTRIQSAPGSVSQLRECTGHLLLLAKSKNIPIILVGHVTKEGAIAGPKILEHMVDTVLYFEGEQQQIYRVLRAVKNRFGSTNEIGVFEMVASGLREIKNPSELFIESRQENTSGSVIVSSVEGTRPLLLELQALVSPSNLSIPRNTTTGVDRHRIALLVAVLQKRVGFSIGDSDVFVNVTGGMRLTERGIDLGIALAIASSYRDNPIDSATVVLGEVGLGGEVRPVSHIEQRLQESRKLGFSRAIFPKFNRKGMKMLDGIELIGVKDLHEALGVVF
ncbi:TPA: DNA repair protein RadA [Candidatus Poribacteria bacterium]|nr:DNA repair protein RadA [Candidatus Poribacteria bacterium]